MLIALAEATATNQGNAMGFGNGNGTAQKAAVAQAVDTGVARMPIPNSASAIEAGRRKRREVIARSGRSSTKLAAAPGTASYTNNFLGGTN